MEFLTKPTASLKPNSDMTDEQRVVAGKFMDELIAIRAVGKASEGDVILCNTPLFVWKRQASLENGKSLWTVKRVDRMNTWEQIRYTSTALYTSLNKCTQGGTLQWSMPANSFTSFPSTQMTANTWGSFTPSQESNTCGIVVPWEAGQVRGSPVDTA